jgi:hypothetical protein
LHFLHCLIYCSFTLHRNIWLLHLHGYLQTFCIRFSRTIIATCHTNHAHAMHAIHLISFAHTYATTLTRSL